MTDPPWVLARPWVDRSLPPDRPELGARGGVEGAEEEARAGHAEGERAALARLQLAQGEGPLRRAVRLPEGGAEVRGDEVELAVEEGHDVRNRDRLTAAVAQRIGPRLGAVRPPEELGVAVPAREVQDTSELQRTREGKAAEDVADPLRAGGRAVGGPEPLLGVREREGVPEQQAGAQGGERLGVERAARDDVRQPHGAGGRAVGAPELGVVPFLAQEVDEPLVHGQ